MEKKQRLLKDMSSVSLGIMVSRILGYLRDMLVAFTFGAGFYADAFYAAFRIPNLFRRLFGESSLNAAFVPVFSEYVEKETKQKIEEFISAITTVMVVVLLFFSFLGIIFSFPITKLITWGFEERKLVLTSKLLQIMFPYMFFICLSALGLSILNCIRIFFIPSVSSSSLSISEIIFILLVAYKLPEEIRIYGLAISVILGGVLQLLINTLQVLKHYKVKIDIKKFFEFLKLPQIKKVYVLFVPVVVGFSIDQINALVDTLCASFLIEGSITALYYSNRLMQLPLALFGIALTSVVLPQMSKEVVNEQKESLVQTLNYSLRNIIYFNLPASLGLIIIGKQIIKTLFEYGKFNYEATLLTFSCLVFYSLGLIFFSTTKIFTTAFYALKQPKYPVKIAAFCVVLNVILNIVLMQFLEVGGLALATSISSFAASAFLYTKLKKLINFNITQIKNFAFKIIFSNLLLIASLIIIKIIFRNHLIITLLGIFFGSFFYILTTKMFKIEEAKIITKFLSNIFYE